MKKIFECFIALLVVCISSNAQHKDSASYFFHHHISICQYTSTIDEDYFFLLKSDGSFVFGKISFGYTGKYFQAFKKEHIGLVSLKNDSVFVTIINTKVTSGDVTQINTNVSEDWRESDLNIPTVFVIKNDKLIPVNGKFPLLSKRLEGYYDFLEKNFRLEVMQKKLSPIT